MSSVSLPFDPLSEVTGNAVELSSSSAAHQEAAKMISCNEKRQKSVGEWPRSQCTTTILLVLRHTGRTKDTREADSLVH